METTSGVRIRTKVATTSQGYKSWEHTVEILSPDGSFDDMVARQGALQDLVEASLQERYGAQQKGAT